MWSQFLSKNLVDLLMAFCEQVPSPCLDKVCFWSIYMRKTNHTAMGLRMLDLEVFSVTKDVRSIFGICSTTFVCDASTLAWNICTLMWEVIYFVRPFIYFSQYASISDYPYLLYVLQYVKIRGLGSTLCQWLLILIVHIGCQNIWLLINEWRAWFNFLPRQVARKYLDISTLWCVLKCCEVVPPIVSNDNDEASLTFESVV